MINWHIAWSIGFFVAVILTYWITLFFDLDPTTSFTLGLVMGFIIPQMFTTILGDR